MAERKPLVLDADHSVSEMPSGDVINVGPAVALIYQADYDALDPKLSKLYLIVDAPAVYFGANVVWAPPASDPPVNTVVPVVSGANYVGDTATASTGSWLNDPTNYAYQWQVYDDGDEEWEDVIGETASTFEDIPDEGEYRVRVVASNAVGASDPAYSAPFVITEPSGVPGYVNSADTGSLYYDGATPTSVTLNGVTSGNSLLLVITGLNEGVSSSDGMEPVSLSNPTGASWGAPVLHRSQDAFGGADQSGLIMYLAHGVSAGNHTITATWPTNGYVGMTLIELENVTAVVGSGSAGADSPNSPPVDMTVQTAANVAAGDCIAVGVAGVGRNWWGGDGLRTTGDSNYTVRHADTGEYGEGRVETRAFAAPGGAPVGWTASRTTGLGDAQGWASGVIVLR